MKIETVQNYKCVVGKSKEENWKLLDESNPNYLFFHLTSFPSCYVILQTEEKVDNNVIIECASLCLNNTKFRHLKNVYVDYTVVENVKKGDKVGEIWYKSFRKVNKVKIK